jgi:DNA-binding FadR family transcriptional regulator
MATLITGPVHGPSWITAQLRQAIQTGQYVHGDKLPPERQLAESFGASRSTVRAALDQLEAERLVHRRVGAGTFVNFPTRSSLEEVADQTSPLDLVDVRLALEPTMVRLACLNAAARDIERMSELMERQTRDCAEQETFSRWDAAFHLAIAEATRNPLLISLYRQINEVRGHQQWVAMRDKVLTAERIAEYNRDHAALFEAIRGRDIDTAVSMITNHLHYARRQLVGARDGLVGHLEGRGLVPSTEGAS